MENKNKKQESLFSRRQFIGKMMLTTAGAAIVSDYSAALAAGKKSPRWKIGAYTRLWGSVDYRVALDGMAEAGYKYAGLSTHQGGRVVDRNSTPDFAATVGEEIKKRGLTLVTNSGGEHDYHVPLKESIESLKRLIDNSALCGAPIIQINAIHNPPELMETFYKAIAECCEYAQEKGILLSLKPHGNVGTFCMEQVRKVDHRNFKVWYDPGNVYHATFGKTDPLEDAADLGSLVAGMAVKDFRMPREVNVTPGTGMVNFPKLLKIMGEDGFKRGPLVVELVSSGDAAHITSEARKARLYLEEITGMKK